MKQQTKKRENLKNNDFIHNGIKYSVLVQTKGIDKWALIHKDGEGTPIAGTMFGNMESFKLDIKPWAISFIQKNF